MKTTLKFLAFFLAAALPSSFAAEFAGAELPAAIDSLSLFSAFVATVVLLTLFSDYAGARFVGAASLVAAEKSPNALAA